MATDSAGVFHDFGGSGAPLFAWWQPHASWGTPMAVTVGAWVIVAGPRVARSVSWRWLPAVSWAASVGWIVSLAMIDGWTRGITSRLTSRDEYLYEIPRVKSLGPFLSEFTRHIVDGQADSWTTQTSGHPPGALLVFLALDRVGLGGSIWAAVVCIVVGASATAAILVALAALTNPETARRCAPFLVLTPAAVWIGVSGDGLFAGVAAWGLVWVALAATRTGVSRHGYALAAGVTLGACLYLSYGLVLLAVPMVAILITTRTLRPLPGVLIGISAVVAVFTVSGFWWLDGYEMVKIRYWQGIAHQRPFAYWGWANWASLICAVGLAVPASLNRVLTAARLRARDPITCLVVGMLAALVLADLSQMSKAETERIWLPFAVWLTVAAATLPLRTQRWWLLVQALAALAINSLLLTNW
ncbi:membrane protein [Mycobacterium antarcticum]|nr:membrane protein [Mycolicibacterium sp. TUM20983]